MKIRRHATASVAVALTTLAGMALTAPPAHATTTLSTFTTVGSTTWTVPAGVSQVDVLIVAGGGGGGGGAWGGGGGGGGVLYGSCVSVTAGANLPVTVGAGGTGGLNNLDNSSNRGISGGNSSFNGATAIGGGGGGGYAYQGGTNYGLKGLPGGSGGGHGELQQGAGFIAGGASTQTAPAGYAAYGNAGGSTTGVMQAGSGGGGAGAPGGALQTYGLPTVGGAGASFDISGTMTAYAGGGGGGGGSVQSGGNYPGAAGGVGGGGAGASGNGVTGTAGAANTGGGGGGAGFNGSGGAGGAGGSGIVIIRAYASGTSCTSDAPQVTVTVGTATGGTATSSPRAVAAGGSVTLSAESSTGYSFSGWTCTVGTLSSSVANPATLSNITADTTCTPAFTANSGSSYTISISNTTVNGSGAASPRTVYSGVTATLSAVPLPNYSFSSWSCTAGTIASPTSATTTLSGVTANATCTPTFTASVVTYTVTMGTATGGTSSASPTTVNSGSTSTLTATPAQGYVFTSWSCTGGTLSSTSTNPATLTVTANATCTPTFTASVVTYTVTMGTATGGTSSASPTTVNSGSTSTLMATPAQGYVFTSWTCSTGTLSSSSTNPATLTVTANATCTPTFTVQSSFAITFASVAGGSGSASPSSVTSGGTTTLTATANPGYTFDSWVCTAGVLTNASSTSTTLTNITAASVCTANFSGPPVVEEPVPAPVTQEIGRPFTESCDAVRRDDLNWSGVESGGWRQSWAQWMNGGLGGFVCTRALVYDRSRNGWVVA